MSEEFNFKQWLEEYFVRKDTLAEHQLKQQIEVMRNLIDELRLELDRVYKLYINEEKKNDELRKEIKEWVERWEKI